MIVKQNTAMFNKITVYQIKALFNEIIVKHNRTLQYLVK